MKWLNETPQEKGRKNEAKFAKRYKGRKTIASGAFLFDKADVDFSDCIVEHKNSTGKSFSLSLKTLEKIEREGKEKNKEGVLVLNLGNKEYLIRRIK